VSKLFILQIKVVIDVWSKTRCAFSNCRVFNFCRLFKIVVVNLAIFVVYLAKPFFRLTTIFVVYLAKPFI